MLKTCQFILLLTLSNIMTAQNNLKMYYNRPANGYGESSPLRSWEVESPKRSHKANPDKAWEKYALPLGNGFTGAMMYGNVENDRIQLNIDSLWSGGPNSESWQQNPVLNDAHLQLDEIRKTLLKRDTKKAQKLSNLWLRGTGPEDRNTADINFGRFQTLGELYIKTGHTLANSSKFQRSLDLKTATHSVSYLHKGTQFKREAFCSYPNRCLVINYSADKPGQQNLHLSLASPYVLTPSNKNGIYVLRGKLKNNGLLIDVRIGVVNSGGKFSIDETGITVSKADAVNFILVADTNYAPTPDSGWRGKDPHKKNQTFLKNALTKNFRKLKEVHIQDYSSLFSRVQLDLGTTDDKIGNLPTDERLRLNKENRDPDLEELYFNFGRYLLISSSREGSLPANLQGIWCNEVVPAWNSDYHFNINLQMNYWPSGPCNLSECQKPLISYIKSLMPSGKVTAKAYSNSSKGWTAHLSSNIWGFTAPAPGINRPRYWSYFPLSGAWLTTHAIEQYMFDNDTDYLRENSWPIIRDTAHYIIDYLYKLPDGTYSSVPSWSPEHGPISLGATCDIAMAREALSGAVKMGKLLNYDASTIEKWQTVLDKLTPYKIGKFGQLQEWYEDIDNPKDKHRHINHLFGTYPGHQVSLKETPKLAEATRQVMINRGYGIFGWSIGWQICLAARLKEADRCYEVLRNLLTKPTQPNLLNATQAFQIDGNLGGTAGIAEMLLQSRFCVEKRDIEILPALPSTWNTGSFSGLRARNGLTVDVEWKNRKLTKITLHPEKSGPININCGRWQKTVHGTSGRSITLYPMVTVN